MTIKNLFYRTSDASCVLNKPKPSSYNLVNILPGTEFSSVDNQCKVLYGQDSFSCLQPGEFTKICIMYVLCISLQNLCSLKTVGTFYRPPQCMKTNFMSNSSHKVV